MGAERATPAPAVVVCLGLLTVALGLAVLASTLPRASVRPAGPPAPINAGAREGLDDRAHNSPSVARNPVDHANLVVANRVDTPQYSCALHVSFDGGATWRETPIPFPAGEELPPRCFAPDLAFGADGTLHVAFVTLSGRGNSPNAVWVAASRDGGRTLATPVRALGRLAFQVQILADAVRPNVLFLFWLQADAVGFVAFPNPANPINVARSGDGGRTWSSPVRASGRERQRVLAPFPVQGRSGELHLAYLELGGDKLDYHGAHEWRGGEPYDGTWRLVLATSSDGGATWRDALVEDQLVPTQRVMVFLPPAPSVAVDARRGAVHVAFHDGREGDANVLLWTSRDGGRTFGAPRRVDDGVAGTSQYLPSVAVSPGGRVDVVYYDRRRDPADLMNEVSLRSSFDGGRTFTVRRTLSDRPFDSRIGLGGARGMPDLGSRLGLLSDDSRALAFWSDTRRGAPDAVRQDLAFAVVAVTRPSAWRRVFRVLALGAGVAGAVPLAFGVVRRRRSSERRAR